MASVFPVEKDFPIPGHWPEGLKPRECYEVLCDDKGRDGGSWLQVFVADDGDVHVSMQDWENVREEGSQPNPFPSIRVRTHAGGGKNSRTRLALLWLAKAIQLDNAEHGQ
jgi:hypothetical protein